MTCRSLAFFSTFLAVLLLASGGGCTGPGPNSEAESLPVTHWFDLDIGPKPARVQLAIEESEHARGLMGRSDLAEDEGMLFVYRQPIQASFWMRNTSIPLDIGFFNGEGVLLEVYPMYPYDETSVKSRSDQVKFALEMNQGWFSENDLRRGARLDLDKLRDALRGRGADPAEFGL